MTTQPEALRLADALRDGTYLLSVERDATEAELRRLHELNRQLTAKGNREVIRGARLEEANQELLEALKLAVLQNSHDMLMTGEELRACEAAIAKHGGAA